MLYEGDTYSPIVLTKDLTCTTTVQKRAVQKKTAFLFNKPKHNQTKNLKNLH